MIINKAIKRFSISIILNLVMIISWPLVTTGQSVENPAHLAFPTANFELTLSELCFNLQNNLFNSTNINLDLDEPGAKEDFLNLTSNGISLTGLVSSKMGFSVKRFGFFLRPFVSGSMLVSKSVPELIFNGIEPNSAYDLSGTNFSGISALSLDFCYGHPIFKNEEASLGAGITMHYLYGLAVGKGELTETSITTDAWGQTEYNAVVEATYGDIVSNDGFSGRGTLFDLGIIYQKKRLTGGLVLKNIGGALTWQNLQQERLTYQNEITGGAEGPDIPDPIETETTDSQANLQTEIPMVLQVYTDYQLWRSLKLNLGLEKGFGEGYGITSATNFWLGAEWSPWRFISLGETVYLKSTGNDYLTELKLKLGFFWLNFGLGWSGGFGEKATGINGNMAIIFHF